MWRSRYRRVRSEFVGRCCDHRIGCCGVKVVVCRGRRRVLVIVATYKIDAAEPKPVHVPRERPPAIVVDDGPLVLVETRRDLRELKLPFEQTALPLQ